MGKSKISNFFTKNIFIKLVCLFLILFLFERGRHKYILSKGYVYTIIYSDKFIPASHLFYHYFIKNEKIEGDYIIPFPEMEKYERGSNLLEKRLFTKVSTENKYIDEINWDVLVPDTLKYIPENGWKEIPYGLDRVKE